MDLSNYIGEKIRYYRKSKRMNQQELGEKIGASKQRISNYETGYRTPQQDDLFNLAEALDVTINDLFPPINKNVTENIDPSNIDSIYSQLTPPRQQKVYHYAENQLEEQNRIVDFPDLLQEEDAEYITLGLYGGVSAGTGQQIYDNPVEEVEVPTSIIPEESFDIMLKVIGDSMEPAFKDGEFVFVKKTPELRSGQFGVVLINNEAYLKKVYIEEEQLRLVSLNEDYDDLIVNESDNIIVIGHVVL